MNIKFTLLIKEELLKKTKHLAVSEGVSASSIIEKALIQYYEKIDQESK